MDDELIEFIAGLDEELLEKYLEEDYEKDLWFKSMKTMIKENKIFPCSCGSALQDIGVMDISDAIYCG